MATSLPSSSLQKETTPNETAAEPAAASSSGGPKRPARRKGPNYNLIHRNLLPVHTHPLPAFHPSNPLSLLRLAYVYLSQLISPPTSHLPEKYVGHFSPDTRSVHVTDARHIRALWEMGFFGKGTLSRSEPSWLEREKARIKAERGGGGTAEEATGRRREERRLFKLERARMEAERIVRQRAVEEGRIVPDVETADEVARDQVAGDDSSKLADVNGQLPTPRQTPEPSPASTAQIDSRGGRVTDAEIIHSLASEPDASGPKPADGLEEADAEIANQEHLQLSLEEAFFLCYGLGVLNVIGHQSPSSEAVVTTSALLRLFSNHSTFPPTPDQAALTPDSPFLLHYVVYHHFRSLGWVVRPGTKFSVDFLLYNRGPVFSHAEFAILIMSAYTDPYWSTITGRKTKQCNDAKPWSWLHCVSRVQSQVRKTLVLCYVDIPAPREVMRVGGQDEDADGHVDVGRLLRRYKVREFVVRRWVANRSRD